MREIGLNENEVFITSPGHYLPLRGTPSKETVTHGREHLFRQIEIIDPKIVVLLGATACFAMLDRTVEISREHGMIIEKDRRKYLVTLHPAYAMRFPEGKRQFGEDFLKLKQLVLKK